MTAFLIGRFVGTFLPSTIGLDGYTLYEADHYSNQWSRATTAKALEKFIGITGLFLGMLVTLPFGYQVLVDVTGQLGRPAAAPLLAGAIAVIAAGVTALVVIMLAWPLMLTKGVTIVGRVLPVRFRGRVQQFALVVGAYQGQVGLLLLALLSKFITHFNTAAVYYFTALAIGVVGRNSGRSRLVRRSRYSPRYSHRRSPVRARAKHFRRSCSPNTWASSLKRSSPLLWASSPPKPQRCGVECSSGCGIRAGGLDSPWSRAGRLITPGFQTRGKPVSTGKASPRPDEWVRRLTPDHSE